jgi:hypothetical protein
VQAHPLPYEPAAKLIKAAHERLVAESVAESADDPPEAQAQ